MASLLSISKYCLSNLQVHWPDILLQCSSKSAGTPVPTSGLVRSQLLCEELLHLFLCDLQAACRLLLPTPHAGGAFSHRILLAAQGPREPVEVFLLLSGEGAGVCGRCVDQALE